MALGINVKDGNIRREKRRDTRHPPRPPPTPRNPPSADTDSASVGSLTNQFEPQPLAPPSCTTLTQLAGFGMLFSPLNWTRLGMRSVCVCGCRCGWMRWPLRAWGPLISTASQSCSVGFPCQTLQPRSILGGLRDIPDLGVRPLETPRLLAWPPLEGAHHLKNSRSQAPRKPV
jgi:hypothetical protein